MPLKMVLWLYILEHELKAYISSGLVNQRRVFKYLSSGTLVDKQH